MVFPHKTTFYCSIAIKVTSPPASRATGDPPLRTRSMAPLSVEIEAFDVQKRRKAGEFESHMARMVPKMQKAKSKKPFQAAVYDEKMEAEIFRKKGFGKIRYSNILKVIDDPSTNRIAVIAQKGDAKVAILIIALRFKAASDCARFLGLVRNSARNSPPTQTLSR